MPALVGRDTMTDTVTAPASASVELPDLTDRTLRRLQALTIAFLALNVLGVGYLPGAGVPPAGLAVRASVTVVGVLLLAATALLASPHPAVRLDGSTLTARRWLITRRIDVTRARMRIDRHVLVARDSTNGRTVRLPIAIGSRILPRDHCAVVVDAIRSEATTTAAADAAATAVHELATNRGLRDGLARRNRSNRTVFLVLNGGACLVAAAALVVRLALVIS